MGEKKTAQLRIDAELRDKFRIAVAEEKTTMKNVMEELIQKWLEERTKKANK